MTSEGGSMAGSEKALELGEGTRGRILGAALDLFGERGLTGVTVRDLATAAGVNVAAISYHFGGKEDLYRAVAAAVGERIGNKVRASIGPPPASPPDPEAASQALERMLETMVDVVVGPPEMRRVARFLIREQMQPTAAFEIIFRALGGLHATACSLFGAAAGLEPESRETRLRVFLLIGQAMFLRVAEAAVLRRMEISHYDPEFLAELKLMLKGNARAMIATAREPRT
jgi:AcrR family transcriptional regulator